MFFFSWITKVDACFFLGCECESEARVLGFGVFAFCLLFDVTVDYWDFALVVCLGWWREIF